MEYSNFLKKYGLKRTKGRIAILKVLSKGHKSIEVDAIYEDCRNSGVLINLSTVYRALELFEEKDIVVKFVSNEGISSYKFKGEEHKHLLKCSVCKKEIEVPCPIRQIEELVENETGFTVVEHNLVMKGICKDCKHNE
ncbi:Fur family transcriptional regulator [Clostridium vincentii]|uniref:Peroxide-responsive repressor PerR n=1 Tax=Clostridium vincentii TaxID=52704 RepID=A0A2T0BG41_9CLOT|nr:Fur family transcriptional regulator [Clostridium vincentii]PRR82797.1 Peroxide-responsive repressor PerR [Clostridium vincentii]